MTWATDAGAQGRKRGLEVIARNRAINGLVTQMDRVVNIDTPDIDYLPKHLPPNVLLVEKAGLFGLYEVTYNGVKEILPPEFVSIERYDPDFPENPQSPIVLVTDLQGRRGFVGVDVELRKGVLVHPNHWHKLVMVMSGHKENRRFTYALVALNPGDELVRYQLE